MHIPTFQNFEQACYFCGVVPVDIPSCGQLLRVPTEKHSRKKNGYIYSFTDGEGAYIGNWENDLGAVYAPKSQGKLSKKQLKQIQKARAEKSRQQEVENLRQQVQISLKAKEFFNSDFGATPALEVECYEGLEHPYLSRKKVSATTNTYECTEYQFRLLFGDQYQYLPSGRLLTFPLIDESGEIRSIQFIDEGGNKYFLRGATTKGVFWVATLAPIKRKGELKIYIAEGVATILSVLENTSKSGLFVSCMNAGNISSVVQALRKRFPKVPIVLLADRDKPKEGQEYGIGITKAQEAQDQYSNIEVIAPPFTEADIEAFERLTGKYPTDWNDFYTIRGAQ